MVSHSVVIRGDGDDKTAEHVVEGNQALHCRYAVLTSVIVQMIKKFSEGDDPETGHQMYGVSIMFPSAVCPPNATHHTGAHNERNIQNRIDVHFSQDTKSLIYKPNLILHDMTFLYDYSIILHKIDSPTTPLTNTEMQKIHSITLNFSLTVSAVLS